MTPPTTDSTGPVLDEATFQKLLAAAYTLQEHNERVRTGSASTGDKKDAPLVDSDTTAALAQIVDAQHQIHANDLDLAGAMNLIVDRIRKITGAQGAAIGLIEQENVRYRACSGTLVPAVETMLRAEAAISASALLHDVLLRCTDANNDFRVNPEIARRLGLQSLIAVPIFHDGKTAGALELVFSKPGAFQEHDVRTCQLMAGLVTEALTHEAQKQWRQGVAAERASMLEVLERIKPQLARLASTPAGTDHPETSTPETTTQRSETADDATCKHCGSEMAPAEMFCGSCGTSRSSVSHKDLQSKWATLWNLQKVSGQQPSTESKPYESVIKPPAESRPYESVIKPLAESKPYESVIKSLPDSKPYESVIKPLTEPEPYESVIKPLADSAIIKPEPLPKQLSEPASPLQMDAASIPESASLKNAHSSEEDPLSLKAAPETAAAPSLPTDPGLVAKTEDPVLLHSITTPPPPATRFGAFLEKHKDFIKKHPGDLALGAAASLFLITILWAVSSNNPTTSADSGTQQGATTAAVPAKPKRKQAPPAPKLSFLDQVLVGLGLADPPPAPTYTGNPDVPVWIDVHTALYYCPGTDLYGKTPQGKIASQRDAQMDQYEPASRKVCD
jgi:putative methionine-R-sulfoxide reductase with GAF domain